MAVLATRAYIVVVFEPGATNQELNNARNQAIAKLQAAGFTLDQIDTYVLRDQLVRAADKSLIRCDIGVARVRGLL